MDFLVSGPFLIICHKGMKLTLREQKKLRNRLYFNPFSFYNNTCSQRFQQRISTILCKLHFFITVIRNPNIFPVIFFIITLLYVGQGMDLRMYCIPNMASQTDLHSRLKELLHCNLAFIIKNTPFLLFTFYC